MKSEKDKNSNQYIFNPALEHIKYDSKVVGRQGEFCHQQNFKCGNLTVWLAVCDGCMPENEAEQFMHGVEKASEKNQTVLLCDKCHECIYSTKWRTRSVKRQSVGIICDFGVRKK